MAVYLNLLLILHFVVNFLLLLGTNRIVGHPSQPVRCALGAALAGGYAALCLAVPLRFLGSPLWRLGFALLVAATAFGLGPGAVRRGCLYMLWSMTLEGIALSADRENGPALVLWALLLYGLCRGGFGGGQNCRLLKLTLGERQVTVLALQDSGNNLHDPITGEPVVVVSARTALRLTGLTEQQLRFPLDTLTQRPIPGLRLIPYHAVGACGMLLGLRIREAELDGRKKDLLVAFAPEGLGKSEVYQALTGGAL